MDREPLPRGPPKSSPRLRPFRPLPVTPLASSNQSQSRRIGNTGSVLKSVPSQSKGNGKENRSANRQNERASVEGEHRIDDELGRPYGREGASRTSAAAPMVSRPVTGIARRTTGNNTPEATANSGKYPPRSRPSKHWLDDTDSDEFEESDEEAGHEISSTRQNQIQAPRRREITGARRRGVPQEETLSEEGEYVPPAGISASSKRKQHERSDDDDLSNQEERHGQRRKTGKQSNRSHILATMNSREEDYEDQGNSGDEDDDDGEAKPNPSAWDRINRSRLDKRERRREKARNVRASTWIKAKAKEKKAKNNMICLGERGPRKEWPEAWKVLANECSRSITQKIRQVTGTNVKQRWSEIPNLDDDGNEMLVIHFSSEAGMKDSRNVSFAKKVVALIREDEKDCPILTAPGRHYISDKFLMQKTFKAMNGFKQAWKTRRDEDSA